MKLYIVATPIGNLKDITIRALEILKSVDFILCEDTRRTIKLLNHFEIKKPLISYHQHSKINKINKIIDILEEGKDLALVSDAGTPGISDPGNKLIEVVLEKMGDRVEIIPVPGPSALISLSSVAGINMDRFVFFGFPPTKKGRAKFFQKAFQSELPVILYESKYRIIKTISEIEKISPTAKLIVGNDLTKKFEKIYRGSINDVKLEIEKDTPRGEFVLIVY